MAGMRIVIIGGGFSGVKCAKTLRSLLPREAEITMFSEENHMVFHPLLAEVAAAKVQPTDMAAVLRELLKGVRCRTEEVLGIDLGANEISYKGDDDLERRTSFDQLVIASGTTANLGVIPGMADHAFPLKTVGDAMALQSHVINQMEKAEICDDAERKRRYLSFIVVGGGFSGVEMAGELNDLVKASSRYYKNFEASEVTVTLVHSHEQILPEVGPSLREFARSEMEKNGVKFILKVHAKSCSSEGIHLSNGEFLKAATVVCTIGSRMLPFLHKLDVPKDKSGRIIVEADMSLAGYEHVWAVGDCARIINAEDGKEAPTTAQFAEREGVQVAKNIDQRLQGKPTRPFSHKSQGMLCSIGGRNAVAEAMGLKISGRTAWFVWRGVYLFKLPSFTQRVRVGAAWAFDLFFPPALTSLHTDQTRHIGKSHYGKGDLIFKKGDPSSDFYVIEEGEVEVFRDGADGITALLGPGDFFGEEALIDGDHRSQSCRARTDAEILVLGREVFSEISNHLAPVKNAIADVMRRKSTVWQSFGDNMEELTAFPLTDVVDKVDDRILQPESKLLDAIQRIADHRLEVCFVVDEARRLLGIISRGDLMHALEISAVLSDSDKLNIKVKDVMMATPLFVTEQDSLMFVISAMREHNYSRLPVVESSDSKVLKGFIRIENVMKVLALRLLTMR
ncbi:MAG: FAD-dependent oxidoreductase [Cyanobacteria bacterium REEB67]|nr:FAD-dependent oxidoreductase [Cyanobacteria bacterium REEB67]